ncbi:hypothetical protein K7X08_029933 [Anisodus acutangulus]|uniref:Protein kinase domain-containing protein n=1 Tax=Anisodus acutangulus TaxID=402998 RepID=A0A9Q1LNG1_9SOLA|nr:hypothetical protein K7X08_029933 [Anisodus acutangulus]
MDQFRQIGEVVGSLKALMVLKNDIQINQRQCCFLFDTFVQAFDTISEEIKHNLRLNERNTKWKALEQPMKELHRIFKEGESYIKYCLDVKDLWGKAISLHMNKDCVEFQIHNLLCCFPVVIEAIETAAEISGFDEEEMMKRRSALMKKYDRELIDPRFFQWMFGKQYLVTREICSRLESSWKEDKWLLIETIRQKKTETLLKYEQRLGDFLLKKLDGVEQINKILLPSSILVGSNDYHVKSRLGSWGGHVKEIQWLGETFALRNFFGEVEPLHAEISLVFSLSHPNILQYHCGFYDEERKEGYLVMELMNNTLATYIKEHSNQRKRPPFSTCAAVDIMLQIARGMEYLHSRNIYHGELNPSHVLLKARTECYFHTKLKGFGLTSIKSTYKTANQNPADSIIWYAPEVLAEQEKPGSKCTYKYTEKADVYSFGMICFQILTGKVPFDEGHLQGEKVVRNIRAGERPLFPYPSPKYLVNLTRRCWHTNPNLRPRFSALCRILRYIKKVLVINPEHGQPETAPPLVDYCDIEAGYSKKFAEEESTSLTPVSQIPFQMFAYRLIKKEKISGKNWDPSNDGFSSVHRRASMQSDDGQLSAMDDLFLAPSDGRSVCSEIIDRKDSRLFDQRSSISEIPHRSRLFLFDQNSVGSESPEMRFSSVAADETFFFADSPDRKAVSTPIVNRSPRIDTLEKKIVSSMSQKLKILDNQEKAMSPKAGDKKPSSNVQNLVSPRTTEKMKLAEQNLVSPRTSEKMKPAEQNLVSPRIAEMIKSAELVSPRTSEKMKPAEQNLVSPRTTETKKLAEQNLVSTQTTETNKSAEKNLVSPQTSEKKTLSYDQKLTSPETQEKKQISSEAPEKKHSSDDQKLRRSKIQDRMKSLTANDKPLHGERAQRKSLRTTRRINQKLTKTVEKKDPEANQIAMSSENHETTAASKTSNQKVAVKRDTKTSTIPEKLMDDSPRSSPARVYRIHSSSPMSSPTRTPKTYPRSPAIISKGYRYQSPSSSPLNPCSRCSRVNPECQTSGIRYCVVHCDIDEQSCRTWNVERRERGEPSYDDNIFEDLVRRFERPDSKNRWDSPLFELWPAKEGIVKSSTAMVDAVSYLTKKVDSKTRDVKILQPTIATQSARSTEANTLYEMDRATQEVTNAIVEAQSRALGGPLSGVSLGPGMPTVDISRSVGLPELRRLRRTFIKLAGQTSLSGPPPPSDADSAKRMFVDYLNRELGSG